jgi:hypothetical protein
MFKPRFAALVEAGVKCQTVRPTPKRTPKPGDRISLRVWTGLPYRSPQRVLREAEVTEVIDITINDEGVFLYEVGRGGSGGAPDRDSFAQDDGFANWSDLRAWFEEAHGLPFSGILIRWKAIEASRDLFGVVDTRQPSVRTSHRDEVRHLKKEHGIFSHHCAAGGDWMALSMPECTAALAGYDLTEEEKTDAVALMAGYCRLLDDAGMIEQGHRTEYDAVKALASRLSANKTGQESGPTQPTVSPNE